MSKSKWTLIFIAVILVCAEAVQVSRVNSAIIDPCKSSVSASPGVILACPGGDGDRMTAPVGGGNCVVTMTVRDNANIGIAGIPATDCWLVGCNDGLLLCGGSSGSSADAATNSAGVTTFSNAITASGCDTGLYAVYQAIIVEDNGTCQPKCLNIAVRSPDYKGGPACPGDNRCPDGLVTLPDFSWFTTHYPVGVTPKPYFACADYAAPLGDPLGLPDFSKFSVHYAGSGHKCPM
jgi:hypothetical protein